MHFTCSDFPLTRVTAPQPDQRPGRWLNGTSGAAAAASEASTVTVKTPARVPANTGRRLPVTRHETERDTEPIETTKRDMAKRSSDDGANGKETLMHNDSISADGDRGASNINEDC